MKRPTSSFFVTGGTLPVGAESYVTRQADADLLHALVNHEFCYVLNTRQMGKSSLCVQTLTKLKERGIRSLFLDLTRYGGASVTPAQWYAGMLLDAGESLGLRHEFLAYFKQHADQPLVQRFLGALQELALPADPTPLVVFIDEVDAVRSLPFNTDEFFAAIRACFNQRAEKPELERLTFCLIGVATPADLISNARVSPFNIGKRIPLNDFTPAEASTLAAGMGAQGDTLLARVLHWTNGHPYLTQRLCRTATEQGFATASQIDALVANLFLDRQARTSDDNLSFVRKRILESGHAAEDILEMYGKVHLGKPVLDDETNALCSTLRLSGVAVADAKTGLFRVRNRIYERVFDQSWIRESMPDAEQRRQRAAISKARWQVGSVATGVVVAMSGLTAWALQSRNVALNAVLAERHAAARANRLAYIANINLTQVAVDEKNDELADQYLEELRPLIRSNPTLETGFEWAYLNALVHPEALLLKGHFGGVNAVALSPNGKWIATGSGDIFEGNGGASARLWDAHTGKLLWVLKGHRDDNSYKTNGHSDVVNAIAFSPDSKRVVTGSDDRTARVWEVATGKTILVLKGHTFTVATAAYSPDGKYIITSSEDKTERVWDAHTGKQVQLRNASPQRPDPFAFSPNRKQFATGDREGQVHLRDADTKTELRVFSGHFERVTSVAFSADGTRLISGSSDNTARVWDIAAPQAATTFTLKSGTLLYADRSNCVTQTENHQIHVWETGTGKELSSFPSPSHNEIHRGTRLDKQHLVLCRKEKAFIVEQRTGRVRCTFSLPPHEGYAGFIHSLAVSADGKRVLTGSGSGFRGLGQNSARVWDAATGKELLSLKLNSRVGYAGAVNGVAFSPDGRYIATASEDQPARLWDAHTGKELKELRGAYEYVSRVAFSPDSKTVLVGAGDKLVRLWDVATGKELRVLKGHAQAIHSLAFSPDGRRILTSSQDKTVRLWDTTTGRTLLTLKDSNVVMDTVAFTPDGKQLITCGADNTVRLWGTP